MEGFADIEGPVLIGLLKLLGIIGLAVLAVLVMVFLISKYWVKRTGRPFKTQVPERSPLEIAMERLDRLQAEASEMAPDPFIVEVSNIVRDYLETALAIPAREQTSEEFLQALQTQESLPEVLKARMPEFLDQCDLVKFARQVLAGTQRSSLLETAGTVVSETDASIGQEREVAV